MYYQRLKAVLKERRIPIKELCERIGITEGGFHQAVKNNSFKVATWELISKELEVPMTYWFVDKDMPVYSAKEADKVKVQQIKYLTEKVVDIKEQNDLLKRLVKEMEEKIEIIQSTKDHR